MQKIIWVSDLHYDPHALVQGHDPRVRLNAAIDRIAAHHPDAVCCVITGDMVETPTAENYAALADEFRRLNMPLLPLCGNHDSHALLRAHFPLPDAAMPQYVQYAVGLEDHVLIALDTLDEGKDSGRLCQARLDWLKATLESAGDTPVSLFMHHPPVKLGFSILDQDDLADADRFWGIAEGFPNLRNIFAGHVHRPTVTHRKGVTITTLPSVLYQAPPEMPAWDWSSFAPAQEAPRLGVIHLSGGQTTVHMDEICAYELGGPIP